MFGDKLYDNVGFPTPTDIPEEEGCRTFTIPSSSAWFAVVMGCLMLLAEEENWQQFDGGITPEEAAEVAQGIIDSGYEQGCASGENDTLVPFWQSDDGSDAAVEAAGDTWYNELSYFVIEAFLATMISPPAAIAFVTTVRRLRLAYLRNQYGGIFEVLLDDESIALIDTYATGTPYGVFYWDTGDDEEHTLTIQNTGDANENASVNPAYGEYTIGIIRWNLNQQSIDFANQQQYDSATDTVQTSTDYGTTWIDSPQVDPRKMAHFPPPDTSDPRCDASARCVAYIEELMTSVEDALAVGALAGTLADLILGSFAVWAGFFALLLFLVDALATVLIDAGFSDLVDNFDSDLYDRLLCYFYGAFSDDGTMDEGGHQYFAQQVTDNESTTVINVIGALDILGGVGLWNDLASQRTETGDCSGCDTTFTLESYLDDPIPYWLLFPGDGVHFGNLNNAARLGQFGSGFATSNCYGSPHRMFLGESRVGEVEVSFLIDMGKQVYFNYFDFTWWEGGTHHWTYVIYDESGAVVKYSGELGGGGAGCLLFSQTPAINGRWLAVVAYDQAGNACHINRVKVIGDYVPH